MPQKLSYFDDKQSFFLTTQWSQVLNASKTDENLVREGLASLFLIYWKPLYRYARRVGQSIHGAEDLIQGFFAKLISNGGIGQVDRERGRFRAYLLASLKNYMANEWQREHRLKRGGFSPHVSIDWQDAETGFKVELEDHRSPDRLFDRDWAITLLDQVLNELERECVSGEQKEQFASLKPFLSISSSQIAYSEIAFQLGVSESAARVAVHRLRKRYRHRLTDHIRRTLLHSDHEEDEMQALFTALSF